MISESNKQSIQKKMQDYIMKIHDKRRNKNL